MIPMSIQGDSGGLGLGYVDINSVSFRGYPETELSQHNPVRDHQNHPVEPSIIPGGEYGMKGLSTHQTKLLAKKSTQMNPIDVIWQRGSFSISLRFLGLILSFFRTHGTLLNVKYIEIRCLSRQNVYTVHPWTLFGIAPTSGLIDYHLLLFSLLTRACISIIKNAKFIKPRECQAIHTARPRLSSRF